MCIQATGLEQLLAIALAIRISELVKGTFRTKAAYFLERALVNRPASLRTISEAKQLPKESKASEIRENIALALSHAKGDWVIEYLVDAIGWEDRSTRCRLELFRQLFVRQPRISKWLEMLSTLPWHDMWTNENPDRAGRLRDLTAAMSQIIRSQRSLAEIDETAGPALSTLMQKVIVISPRAARPMKLAEAAEATIDLMDEMLATEFNIDPRSGCLCSPSSNCAMVAITILSISNFFGPLLKLHDKSKSAIRLRARMGQRSEMLIVRLRQALGTAGSASKVLMEIAESESGLQPDVDDWLRGNVRENSSTAAAIGAVLSRTDDIEIARSKLRL